MQHGTVSLIIGPMFSGKTSELFRRIRRETIAKKKCILIKYAYDNRYSEQHASTHDLFKMDCIPCVKLSNIEENVLNNVDVIGIDEGQFFEDIVEIVEKWSSMGITVIVCGLDGNYKREPFGNLLKLIPKSLKVDKLTAVCTYCGQDAPFTKRTVVSEDEVLIGGTDKYVASCVNCYFK
jgi:thymidine kinase